MKKGYIGQPTLNGKPIEVTDSWDKMTFSQYLRLLNAKDDTIEIISIITGIENETLRKAKIGGLPKLMYLARFMQEPPKFPDKPTKIGKYKLPLNSQGIFDIQLESLAQFEDMRVIMYKLKEGVFAHTEAYAAYCALYLQKIRDGEYDSDKAIKMVPEIMNYPAADIITAGSFFFVKLQNLSNGIDPTFPTTKPVRKKPIGKRSKRNLAHMRPLTKRHGR